MATSEQDLTPQPRGNRFLEFLGRRPNIVGCGVALVSLAPLEAIDAALRGPLSIPVVLAAYVSGYLMGGDYRADVDIQVGSKSDRVEIGTIKENIATLRQTLRKYDRRLPEDIKARCAAIFQTLEEILPRWDKLASFTEEKYTINALLTEYLPTTLSNYLNLPASYYKNGTKNQFGEQVLEQLQTLLTAVQKIRDSVYAGVEKDISQQTMFLKDRFTENEGLKLS